MASKCGASFIRVPTPIAWTMASHVLTFWAGTSVLLQDECDDRVHGATTLSLGVAAATAGVAVTVWTSGIAAMVFATVTAAAGELG